MYRRTIVEQRVVDGDPVSIVGTRPIADGHLLVLRAVRESNDRTPALNPLRLGRGGVGVKRESGDRRWEGRGNSLQERPPRHRRRRRRWIACLCQQQKKRAWHSEIYDTLLYHTVVVIVDCRAFFGEKEEDWRLWWSNRIATNFFFLRGRETARLMILWYFVSYAVIVDCRTFAEKDEDCDGRNAKKTTQKTLAHSSRQLFFLSRGRRGSGRGTHDKEHI